MNLRKPNSDFSLGVVLIILAAIGFWIIIPAGIVTPKSVDVAVLSPDFWPKIIIGLLGLVGFLLSVKGWRESTLVSKNTNQNDFDSMARPQPLRHLLRFLPVIIVLIAYYFLIPNLGMVLPAILSIIILMAIQGEKRWWLIVLIAVGLPVLLFAFFNYVANIPLPLGIFERWR